MSSGCVAITSQTVAAVTFTGQGLSASVGSGKLDAGAGTADIEAAWVACNALACFVELDNPPTISTTNNTATATTLIKPDFFFITSLLITLVGLRYKALRRIELTLFQEILDCQTSYMALVIDHPDFLSLSFDKLPDSFNRTSAICRLIFSL